MTRIALLVAIVGLASSVGAGPAVAATEENQTQDQALTDLVKILRNEGVIDEGQYNQLSAKAAKREAKESSNIT